MIVCMFVCTDARVDVITAKPPELLVQFKRTCLTAALSFSTGQVHSTPGVH